MSKGSAGESLQAQKDFKDFCGLPNLLLSSFDMDFSFKPRSMPSRIFRKCYFCLAIVSHIYVSIFISKATLSMPTSDEFELPLFLHLMSSFTYAVFSSFKCMTLCWNRKRYRKIFEVLQEIYPKTKKEKLNFKIRNYFWPKWNVFIINFYVGAAAFFIVAPFLESIVINVVNILRNDKTSADFIYNKIFEIEYTFNHQSLLRYLITYLIEAVHSHLAIVFNISGDVWLLCFTLQLCMQFDNIQQRLETYQPDEKKFLKDQQFIAEVVKRHQTILNLSQDVNESFGLILLLELMSTAILLCCAGVYCLTQDLGRELFVYVAMLPPTIGQYFLTCYYGQLLIKESEKVAEAAYNNNWYDGSRSYRKSIFIILMRAQKVVELNALGLQSICLEAFKMVMGGAYRVFALLRETML